MKVFLMAYSRMNLGDDLFIKMLIERYKNIDFYIKVNDLSYLKSFSKNKNLHSLIGNDTDEELYKLNVETYDAYVYIGGSIFMEGGKVYNLSNKFYDFLVRCKEKNIPFFYISSNYGPYKTVEYFNLSRKAFSTCTDICFRDKYSYNLFKNSHSVRYAPDFIFSYEHNYREKIPNSIGISVIDLGIREDLSYLENSYINFLINNIKYYFKIGKKVYLFSFCKHEGDEKTINKIMKYFEKNNNIFTCMYNGNISDFLDMYSKMDYMICARFHSIVLSSVFEQNIFVMSYSNKIDNVIYDLNLNYNVLNFKDINENSIINIEQFSKLDKNKLLKISQDSQDRIKIFDKTIKKLADL